jgi:uncharacterized protein with ParB-like and HNH nuclease domain
MDAAFLKSNEIDDIFKNHLKTETKVMSIESIFSNKRFEDKIDSAPYYQRKYVWDQDKATYFIESILLGTEIPPLVFFDNQEKIEIIDGRQRYETIKKFIHRELTLSKNGLKSLTGLKTKSFEDLDSKIKEIFWDTKIRLLEFSVVNEPKLDDNKEDLIKKEIFRRYNSGITPLKNSEIENASYINDDLTKYFKDRLKKDKETYMHVLTLFFTERDLAKVGKKSTLDRVMSKLRHLLVMYNIPIKKYSTLSGRADYLTEFYEILSNNTPDVEDFYAEFKNKIYILVSLKKLLEKESELSMNKLVFECTFWMLTILEHEIKTVSPCEDDSFLSNYAEYLIKNQDKFSLIEAFFYKKMNERYNIVAKYFEMQLNIKCNVYLDDYSIFKETTAENEVDDNPIKDIKNLEHLRLNKPEPSSLTIEDICRQMNRDKFLIRPPYQREEVINKVKSSAIIESIILGVKLPPIFIYKTINGIHEVVDGQQRILSILGFIGEEFTDENGNKVKSEKNNFELERLTILSEINGKKYGELDSKIRYKILDFNLAVVFIEEKMNPNFDKIDLFIRLNNKPYPIKDNSFEMWNSYVDKQVISTIKDNVKTHSSWFYLKISETDTRMENEELYAALSYLEYKKDSEELEDITSCRFLSIYQKENKIYLRVKEKPDITMILNSVTTTESDKKKFLASIKNVESFIKKLKLVLLDKDISNEKMDEYLKTELNSLFSPSKRGTRRTIQGFYSLWIILYDIKMEMVRNHRHEMKKEISDIYIGMRNSDENTDVVMFFRTKVDQFKEKYKTENRRIKLSDDEKNNLILKQGNICPVCKGKLYIGDEIEVDHCNPLALGGRDSFLNLKVVHKSCNREKQAKLIY